MTDIPDKPEFVIVIERSGGNESVGDMWLETKIYPADATLEQVYNWAIYSGVSGKIIITKPIK